MPEQLKQIPAEIRDRYLLLWDSQCDFCRRSVEWISKKAPKNLIPLPYQKQAGWLPPEIYAGCKRQLYLLTPQGIYLRGGKAVIEIFGLIGWKTLSQILRLPGFRQLTGLIYSVIAKNRGFLSRLLSEKP
jgi:predicted DCC family thiol-disulfide oxidoreductase YuxK